VIYPNPGSFQPLITRSASPPTGLFGALFQGIPAIPDISCRIALKTILQGEKPACLELSGWAIPEVRDGLDGQAKRRKSPGKKPPVFAIGGAIRGARGGLDGQGLMGGDCGIPIFTSEGGSHEVDPEDGEGVLRATHGGNGVGC